MVEQQNGSTYTQMLYSQVGKTAIMNGQTLTKAFVYLPGGATAIYNSSGLAYYRHADWLGTSRVTSTAARGVYSDSAYAPFGEQYDVTGTADASFTGQNADTTSSLYDFTFREHSPSQGRWISPDPSGTAAVDPTSPQSWNRYAYVVNNPLSNIDPLGLDCIYLGSYENGATSEYTDQNGNQISVVSGDCNSDTDNGYYVDGTIVGGAFGVTLSGNPDSANFYLQGNDEYQSICTANDCSGYTGGVDNSYLPLGSIGGNISAANNGNFSWWGAFAKNLFSWKNFADEFKQGGCVGVFVDAASEGGILPDLPAGHGVEDAVTDASKMAAATYAVNQGLVVPLRSSVVRGILDIGETSASGLVLLDTYAKIGAGGKAEINAIKSGDCH
jgi:RHS repeat-associated protein